METWPNKQMKRRAEAEGFLHSLRREDPQQWGNFQEGDELEFERLGQSCGRPCSATCRRASSPTSLMSSLTQAKVTPRSCQSKPAYIKADTV